jgi:hypothetical protein
MQIIDVDVVAGVMGAAVVGGVGNSDDGGGNGDGDDNGDDMVGGGDGDGDDDVTAMDVVAISDRNNNNKLKLKSEECEIIRLFSSYESTPCYHIEWDTRSNKKCSDSKADSCNTPLSRPDSCLLAMWRCTAAVVHCRTFRLGKALLYCFFFIIIIIIK